MEISEAKIIKAALNGVKNAQDTYEKLSGGYWLWEAPEYLATVCVAKELGELSGAKYVTLENSTHSAIKDAGARGRGKLHHDLRAGGRTDILLWSSNETPRVPIEIKIQVTSAKKIICDAKRIEKMVLRRKSETSIEFGMIVYYISLRDSKNGRTANEKINSRIDKIIDDVRSEIGNQCNISQSTSKIITEGDSAWAAVALVIKPFGE